MADASVRLGQLADEFTGRVRDGDRPDVEDYVRRHPALAERIRALFPTLLMLEGLAGPAARAAGRDGERAVRVWRVESGEELFRWRPATKPVRRLTFMADGSELGLKQAKTSADGGGHFV